MGIIFLVKTSINFTFEIQNSDFEFDPVLLSNGKYLIYLEKRWEESS